MVCKKHNEEKIRQNGRQICRTCHAESSSRYYAADPRRRLLSKAKVRAKRDGVLFSLELNDVIIPVFCPVLGIKLNPGVKTIHDASPTIDRFKPELGYVPGNIKVVSYRANTIKSIGTAEEHEKVAVWMRASEKGRG